MELLPPQPAEQSDFETESDGETEKEECMYGETLQYLMHGRYPEGASKHGGQQEKVFQSYPLKAKC